MQEQLTKREQQWGALRLSRLATVLSTYISCINHPFLPTHRPGKSAPPEEHSRISHRVGPALINTDKDFSDWEAVYMAGFPTIALFISPPCLQSKQYSARCSEVVTGPFPADTISAYGMCRTIFAMCQRNIPKQGLGKRDEILHTYLVSPNSSAYPTPTVIILLQRGVLELGRISFESTLYLQCSRASPR